MTRSLYLRECAWCGGFKFGSLHIHIPGLSHKVAWYVKLWGLRIGITHGICHECRANLTADMGRMLD